jgi:type II secretory pathway component PulC
MAKYNPKLLLAAAIFLFLTGCDKPPEQTARPPQSPLVKIGDDSPKQLKKQEMESLLNELKLKNPFTPKHFKKQVIRPKKEIELEGIMWDNQKPFAVIDGGVVAEGDFINGKKVIKIHNESVILDNQGREEILKIKLKWE